MQVKNWIRDFDFNPSNLVLVWNTWIEKELNQKTKPRYLGLMVVLCWTTRGSYLLTKLDGTMSKLWYTAFRLLLYYPRTKILILVMDLIGLGDQELDDYKAEEDVECNKEDDEGGLDN